MTISTQQQTASEWFRNLCDRVCAEFERLEDELTGALCARPGSKAKAASVAMGEMMRQLSAYREST